MREKLLLYTLLMILVPIAGEFKFYPLDMDIRISLGTPVFFFALLWSQKFNPRIAGLLVGVTVVTLRITLSALDANTIHLQELLVLHGPAFFYYVTYGLLFHSLKVNSHHNEPLKMGVCGVAAEVISSLVEIYSRAIFSTQLVSLGTILLIVGIAVIRSFFVLGFFNIIILKETKRAEEEHKKRNEKMLMLISNLYIEMIQLNKSMKNAEQLTQESYELYRLLKNEHHQASNKVLKIAGKIHEMKKDHQRIHSGLTKLMVKGKITDYMAIKDIIEVIVTSNCRYRDLLNKEIEFVVTIEGKHPNYHTYLLLSVINNLVANAIEAIHEIGIITIQVSRIDDHLFITVSDNGPGIAKKHQKAIFQPGFTTKFDKSGQASNGIGLAYVKDTLDEIGGAIELLESTDTTFTITLPIIPGKVSETL